MRPWRSPSFVVLLWGFDRLFVEHLFCARVENEWICSLVSVACAAFCNALPSWKGCNTERDVMGKQQWEACMKNSSEGGKEELKCCCGFFSCPCLLESGSCRCLQKES